MYQNLKWATTSDVYLTTWLCLALSAIAQSTLPPGVAIPSTTPDAIEQTIPQPSRLTLPLLPETPTLPPIQLQTPSTQEPP